MIRKAMLLTGLLLLALYTTPAFAQQEGHEHQYVWQSDESGCWQACACGAVGAKNQHREFCPGDGRCDECGYAASDIKVYHDYSVYVGCDETGHLMMCPGCENTITEAHYGACTDDGCAFAACEYDNSLQDGLHSVTHNYGREYVCDENEHYRRCSGCGKTTEHAAHVFQFSHVVISTCLEAGYKVERCVCGTEKRTAYSELGDHQYTVTDTPAECEKPGTRLMVCIVCGETLVDTFPALNHAWDNYDRDVPTCTQPGMTYYECTRCGDYLDEPLPAYGHKYKSMTVGGETVRVCSVCGEKEDAQALAQYALIYEAEPDQYGEVRVKMHDSWTAEDYAACRLVIVMDDGQTQTVEFTVEDNEIVFHVEDTCITAFIAG